MKIINFFFIFTFVIHIQKMLLLNAVVCLLGIESLKSSNQLICKAEIENQMHKPVIKIRE